MSLILPFRLFLCKLSLLLFAQKATHNKTEEEIRAEYEQVRRAAEDIRHFAPLYETYYEPIFIFINRRLDNEEVTAEITASVFLKCLENIKKFEFRAVPFSAWLFRIALNEINAFFRSEKTHPRAVALQDKHISGLFEEIQIETSDPHQTVRLLLEDLSPADVRFLELRFFESRSFREIGFLLEMSEANAKVKTYRILTKLRKRALELLGE